MATLRTLSNRMEKLNRELPRKVNAVARIVATATLRGLVRSTPVDTSQAVSNWQLGYDEANLSNIPPHVPGKGGLTGRASSTRTLLEGKIWIRGKRPGVALHISNGLPYIKRIDRKYFFKQDGLAAGRAALAAARLKI